MNDVNGLTNLALREKEELIYWNVIMLGWNFYVKSFVIRIFQQKNVVSAVQGWMLALFHEAHDLYILNSFLQE